MSCLDCALGLGRFLYSDQCDGLCVVPCHENVQKRWMHVFELGPFCVCLRGLWNSGRVVVVVIQMVKVLPPSVPPYRAQLRTVQSCFFWNFSLSHYFEARPSHRGMNHRDHELNHLSCSFNQR